MRKLIGIDEAIDLSGGGLSLNPGYCWVDAFSFEGILSRVYMGKSESKMGSKKAKKDEIELLEKCMELYKGTFLAKDQHKPWSVSYRERLKDKFIRCINELGNRYERQGDVEKAIECYQKGLEADELTEDFYFNMIRCYKTLGQNAEAVNTYHRCRKILASALGIEPSLQTRALYESIKRIKKII